MELKDRKISSYISQNKLDIENIMKDFSNYVYTIIRKSYINLSNEDTEEIVLDVFFTVWKNQEKLCISKNMSAYIAGITKNLILKKYRNIKLNENINDYEEQLIQTSNIELYFIEKENTRNIIEEIKNLKEQDRLLFIQYYYEEKSIKEIADYYNMTQAKVKSKLFRIRKKLKKFLKERGYDFNER